MATPHKYADVIKAWADGHEIEYRMRGSRDWVHLSTPSFDASGEYRVKQEPIPNIIRHIYVGGKFTECVYTTVYHQHQMPIQAVSNHYVKLTFDGTTNELISAEVIK